MEAGEGLWSREGSSLCSQSLPIPGQGAGETQPQGTHTGVWCTWEPWAAPGARLSDSAALELGRNPLQCFMPFCAVLLAAGKGPRNPRSYWAVVNRTVSVVCSPIHSAAKGRTNHMLKGLRWWAMGREASAGTKLFFKPEEHDVFPSAGGWMAGFGKACSFQEGTSEDAQDTSGWHIPQTLLSLRSDWVSRAVWMQRPDPSLWSGSQASDRLLLSLA